MARTDTYKLLLSTGDNFDFALLLTQSDALSYGYHLAQIAADNSSDPAQQRVFAGLGEAMSAQFQQVIAMLRTVAK
jgi:hypothetical protein